MSESNPLGIVMLCETRGHIREFPHPRSDDSEPCVPAAYIPLRHVPEDVLEAKRAELLEFNSKDGLRKLTDEERERMNTTPDTAESVGGTTTEPDHSVEHAEPPDLLPGEGFGS